MATPEESLSCPITLQLFVDPVSAGDGHTYERQAIEEWIRQHRTSPITRQPLSLEQIQPNYLVKQLIESFQRSTREKEYQFTLDVDVKKSDSQPFIQTFGKSIYRAQWLPTNRNRPEIVLLKIDGTRAKKEASFYVNLSRHLHIVRTFGFVYDNDNHRHNNSIMLLQEYAREGNLSQKLQDCQTMIKEEVLIEICLQMIDAMVYLALNDVVHGDLACRNVLIFRFDKDQPKRNLVKLTDFGISRYSQLYSTVPGAAQTQINIVPTRYAAPEILATNVTSEAYTEKSDVYSMGVLMWEAYSQGGIPWSNIANDEDVVRHVRAGNILSQPSNCSQQYWSLMRRTWSKNAEDRPSFRELEDALKERYYHEENGLIGAATPPTTTITAIPLVTTVTPNPHEVQGDEVEHKHKGAQSIFIKALHNSGKAMAKATGINATSLGTNVNHLIGRVTTVVFKDTTKELIPYQNVQLEERIDRFDVHSVVNLNDQYLVDQDMQIVVREAIMKKQCRVLLLKKNTISSVGASLLAEALRTNVTLQELDLSHTELSDTGVKALAKVLQTSDNTLVQLGLGWNRITDKGARYLADMLKSNRRLLGLGLFNNEIGDEGVKLLAVAIERDNTSLQGLCLDENNSITDGSIGSLVDMIKNSRSLKQLWINDCRLSDKSKKKLRKAADSKQNFQLEC